MLNEQLKVPPIMESMQAQAEVRKILRIVQISDRISEDRVMSAIDEIVALLDSSNSDYRLLQEVLTWIDVQLDALNCDLSTAERKDYQQVKVVLNDFYKMISGKIIENQDQTNRI